MLAKVLAWGLKPVWVTGDSWYSPVKNLKTIKKHGPGFLFGLKGNRTVSIKKGDWQQVQSLNIPAEGLIVWLKDFGYIKLFRTYLKDQARYYAVSQPSAGDSDNGLLMGAFDRRAFETLHSQHWQIEQYHRVIKQVCNVECFQVRSRRGISNHIFASLTGYVMLQKRKIADVINNCYRLRPLLFKGVMAEFIKAPAPSMRGLLPKFCSAVNA